MRNEALIFWFTGLSGSGKTTAAEGAKRFLESDGYSVLILDGDDVRKRLHIELGFTEKDIKRNNVLIVELCQKYRREFDIIMVSVISPYRISRENARAALRKDFYEVYFSASLETVMKRDVKGLYSRAQRNEIRDLIGYSPENVYEKPDDPDLIVDSTKDSAEKSIDDLYRFVINKFEDRSHA